MDIIAHIRTERKREREKKHAREWHRKKTKNTKERGELIFDRI